MRLKKVLPILLFSGLFGFFLWQIYFVYNSPGYNPLWHGWWIAPSELEGDVFYFRKKFNLSDNIKNAWLLVSASDEFKVYLNGEVIGTADLDGWFPLGIYDVTKRINLGVNTLGVRVEKRSFKGSVKTAVELGYEDTYGNKHYVFSDETWKLSNKEERNSVLGLYWYDSGFNDANWAIARILEKPKGFWLNLDPWVYTAPADGQWFWAGGRKEISCRAEIYVPEKPKAAWIRLASRGGFRVLINKKRVDVGESIVGTEVMPKDVLRTYEIGHFLSRGNNTIFISIYAEGPERGLYVDGIIRGTDWMKGVDRADFKCFYPGESTPLLTYGGDYGWISIKSKLIRQDIYTPIELSVLSYSTLMFIFCIISAAFIGLTFVFRVITRLSFHFLSRAYLIPSLFLIFIYILRYDVRFYPSFPFQGRFLILSLCLLFLFWLINPLINKVKIRD